MTEEAARQFSFRLPDSLVERIEQCQQSLRATGLDVNRADVVRLLLKHALDATHCNIDQLFGNRPARRVKKKKK
jgi:Arc/MetJ-type ribon-helix-helix transcriptional regulator